MKHFLFFEAISGEYFIVGEYDFTNAAIVAEGVAQAIAECYNDEYELRFLYEMTDDEAEMSGLDEY